MKVKEFTKKLEKIMVKHGEDLEVVMADFIPVVEPVFSFDKYSDKKIVITDKNEISKSS